MTRLRTITQPDGLDVGTAALPLLADVVRPAGATPRLPSHSSRRGGTSAIVLRHLSFASVLLACLAFGLIRQPCNDIGWHLATARTAFETGHWPITNSFSHIHSHYPLDQQYPLFQTVLYAAYQLAGWNGLSLLNAAGWLCVLLLFMRWGGSARKSVWLHLPWMIGLFALQRRMILRPDMFSMLFLGLELLVIDRYLAGRRRWIFALPAIHWAWANSHQLFPLSLAVQGLLVGHLVLTQRGMGFQPIVQRASSPSRDPAPVWPALLALMASVCVSLLTPLGTGILRVVANTSGSLAHHRGDVQEFAYLWQRPWEMQLAIACGVLGVVGLWRMRRSWRLVDVGLWFGTLVMMLGAVRGLVFFGPVSIALFARSLRAEQGEQAPPPLWRWPALRTVTIAATLLLAGNVIAQRWVRPSLALGGTQPGLGQSLGDWPDGAIAFLQANPPPGQMLNLPWSLGSPLILALPNQPVFVDARLEAYPRAFLVECMAAERDDTVLARLLAQRQPGWIVANHRDADVRARVEHLLATGAWACVYADTLTIVLVHEIPETQPYLQNRRLQPDALQPADLLTTPAELRALQLEHFERLKKDLSEHGVPDA